MIEMTYNFTIDGYVIDGVSTAAGNDTVYEFTGDFTPITEILLCILFINFLQLIFRIRRK